MREIANCPNLEAVCEEIEKFINECNARKPAKATPFKSYYKRLWMTPEGLTKIDVGSHTEFFYWEGSIEELTIKNRDGEVEIEG